MLINIHGNYCFIMPFAELSANLETQWQSWLQKIFIFCLPPRSCYSFCGNLWKIEGSFLKVSWDRLCGCFLFFLSFSSLFWEGQLAIIFGIVFGLLNVGHCGRNKMEEVFRTRKKHVGPLVRAGNWGRDEKMVVLLLAIVLCLLL